MKEELVRALRREQLVSGGELARRLGVSRTTVWKYVCELRKKGYDISASPGLGYSLIEAPELLLPEEIGAGLNTHVLGKDIAYYETIDSTQDAAKQAAAQGAREGTTVIAERQTKGRGRMGRSWVSPLGAGIYLSIILKPDIKPMDALQIPLIAGVAVVQAIERVTSLKPRIKWPNDILIQGKKAGGILTEMSAEMDRINYIVLGIGLNVNTQKLLFPEEIREISTSLAEEYGERISRVQLVQHLLEEFESLYEEFKVSGFETIREKWKMFSSTIGSWVKISGVDGEVEGKVEDIDVDGALMLRGMDGVMRRIISGDVSLRGLGSRYS